MSIDERLRFDTGVYSARMLIADGTGALASIQLADSLIARWIGFPARECRQMVAGKRREDLERIKEVDLF